MHQEREALEKREGNPQPGGWSRFMIVTEDLDGMIDELREVGATFRGALPRRELGGKYCFRILRGMSSSCSSTQNTSLARGSRNSEAPSQKPRKKRGFCFARH